MLSIRYRDETAHDGLVQVWDEPRDGAEYTIGIDCAGGGAAGDPAAACVIENDSCALVAIATVRMDPVPWAEQMAMLGDFYKSALLAFETYPSAFGLASCQRAIALDYPSIYRAQRLNTFVPEASMNLGWRTDSTSKDILIERIKTALRDRYVMSSKELCRELGLRQWIGDESKDHADKFKFGGKGHDDLVIAWGIALCVRDQTWIKPEMYAPKAPLLSETERIWRHHDEEMAAYQDTRPRRRDYAWI